MTNTHILRPTPLIEFTKAVLESVGVPSEPASITAQALVQADLEGVDTHGLGRLAIYIKRLELGAVNATAQMESEQTAFATARLNADNGLGQPATLQATSLAIKLAQEAGIGAVGVYQSNHCGALSFYTEHIATSGYIGVVTTNAPPGVVPTGAKHAFFGTNPIGIALPGKDGVPVSIDLSTSVVARGNVILAAKEGRPIPNSWALDAHGLPTTDAAAAMKGGLLPMAGAKGYALGLVLDVLAGVLTGSNFAPRIGSLYDDFDRAADVGQFVLAIDPARFVGTEEFLQRLEIMLGLLLDLPAAQGEHGVRLPGIRRKQLAQRRQSGIPYGEATFQELKNLSETYKIPLPQELR